MENLHTANFLIVRSLLRNNSIKCDFTNDILKRKQNYTLTPELTILIFASTICVSRTRRNLKNFVMEFKTERAHEQTQQTTGRTTDH